MNAFATALVGMRHAHLQVFGEPVTVTVDTVATVLTGIVRLDFQDQRVAEQDLRDTDPTVLFDSTDFAAAAATNGAVVTARGIDYRITAIEPDDGGMTRCRMREFQ